VPLIASWLSCCLRCFAPTCTPAAPPDLPRPHVPPRCVQYLEWREKQYDVREYVDVFNISHEVPAVKDVLVYIATPNVESNVNYLGPAPLEAIAQQIASAHGPSGPNYEYLYNLAAAIREVHHPMHPACVAGGAQHCCHSPYTGWRYQRAASGLNVR
jgi:hypothetical protein